MREKKDMYRNDKREESSVYRPRNRSPDNSVGNSREELGERRDRAEHGWCDIQFDGGAVDGERVGAAVFVPATNVAEAPAKAVLREGRAGERVETRTPPHGITERFDRLAQFFDQPPLALADFPVLLRGRLIGQNGMSDRVTTERHTVRLHLANHVPRHPHAVGGILLATSRL